MAAKKKENPKDAQNAQENVAPAVEINASTKDFPNELREAFWSVISFEKCEASSLTYAEAEQKMRELETQSVSGLCIVTDETAARISDRAA